MWVMPSTLSVNKFAFESEMFTSATGTDQDSPKRAAVATLLTKCLNTLLFASDIYRYSL